MRQTNRLEFISNLNDEILNELWQNCFEGQDNMNHMNRYVPYPVTSQYLLNEFLINQRGWNVWLIKRINEKDIIGFAIHGNFIPFNPNNIGFNIGLNYTRQGYATETLNALIEHLREKNYTKTFGLCFENNTPSIKTMENCGFENMGPTGRIFNNIHELRFRKNI